MPVDQFETPLEISVPFEARGVIERNYDISRMYVGLVQVDRNPRTGRLELTAGAYGQGAAALTEVDHETSTWKMQLRPDSEHPDFHAGRAIGFVLVELAGGRVTGWLDDGVELTAGAGGEARLRI